MIGVEELAIVMVMFQAKSFRLVVGTITLVAVLGNQSMAHANSENTTTKPGHDASDRGVVQLGAGVDRYPKGTPGGIYRGTSIGAGVELHDLVMPSGARVCAVVVDTRNGAWNITPVVNKPIATTTKSAQMKDALVAINGGYFNMSDGDSVSFVTLDGKQVCDPRSNKALVENEKLKPFLSQIFNREEFRVYADEKGKRTYAIVKHDAPLPAGTRLVHALQGGPMLLPAYTAREGAFVRKDASGAESDSIGTTKPAARTAIGIAKDAVVLLIVEGRRTKEFSTGATLPELAELLKSLGCTQALNFDGGTSTTMVVRLPRGAEDTRSEVVGEGDGAKTAGGTNQKVASGSSQSSVLKTIFSSTPERRVKSVLIVTPTE